MTMLNQDTLREATRLTQAGQLSEATALLQRMLRGERPLAEAAAAEGLISLPGRTPPTIDLKANGVGNADRAPPAETPATARRHRPLFDRAKDGTWLGLRGAKRAPASMTDIAPVGTKFIEGTYSNKAGSRTYKLFVPSRYHQGQPLPLVVMLHGCTQSPDDFAAGTRMNFIAEEQSCLVVYPAQPGGANPSKCWNWFRAADQRRDEGEPSLIAGITRRVMQEYSVDPKRVFVAGLSAGGAAAAVMGATYSDLYAAVGIHSGLAYGAASDLPSAFVAMRQGNGPEAFDNAGSPVPTIVFHGDRDTTVHPSNGDRIVEQSAKAARAKAKAIDGRVPRGYAYTRTILTDAGGRAISEHWNVHGAGHAWSGGSPAGSYTDARGPDATREMLRFFLEHSLPG
jgi:poly(hydroxyalkanoate) depolymerase family esterase